MTRAHAPCRCGGAAVEAEATPPPSPVGSDLWLDEFSDKLTLTTTVDVPEGISVLIAAPGAEEAPTRRDRLASRQLDSLGGAAHRRRRARVPRRYRAPHLGLPSSPSIARPAPEPPEGFAREAAERPEADAAQPGDGRRPTCHRPRQAGGADPAPRDAGLRAQRVLRRLLAELRLGAPATRRPPRSATPNGEEGEEPRRGRALAEPAVTVPQMERIMRRVAVFANEVDASRDATVAAQRFTGPALESRRPTTRFAAGFPTIRLRRPFRPRRSR